MLCHKCVVVEFCFDLRGDVFRFGLLFERSHGDEDHKHHGANRADHDKRSTAPPFFDEFAVGVVGEFAKERQHKQRQEVVKTHNESARPTRQAVCVFQKKGNDEVVRCPKQHNNRECETDLKGLRIVEFERRSAFLVEHWCRLFLFNHN